LPKVSLSKRTLAVILTVIIALTIINAALILGMSHVFDGAVKNNTAFDYIIYQDGGTCKLKNMATDSITYTSKSASDTLNKAFAGGNAVCLQKGNYSLTGNVYINNKMNALLVGYDAWINGDGNKIIIHGDDYTFSKYNSVSGFTFVDATLRVENSFMVSISDMVFENCQTAIEFANSNTWSEGSKIEDCHFINSAEGISFRTPIQNGTGSYESSQINRCYFNIKDNSAAITVEPKAELSNSQLQDIRVWVGENGVTNQIGLKVNGAMTQTLLTSVIFESFAPNPTETYAIALGQNSTCPVITQGVTFLGNWTARIYNPNGIWISGVGAVFNAQNQNVAVGSNGQYGAATTLSMQPHPLFNFKPKITVSGNFAGGEVVAVRVRIETIDNVYVGDVTKHYSSAASEWLSDQDMLTLIPSESLIWAVLVDAQSNLASSNVFVTVGGYGTTG
jgi:hypothetical protein